LFALQDLFKGKVPLRRVGDEFLDVLHRRMVADCREKLVMERRQILDSDSNHMSLREKSFELIPKVFLHGTLKTSYPFFSSFVGAESMIIHCQFQASPLCHCPRRPLFLSCWVLGVDDVEVVVVAEEDNTCCLISLFSLDNVIALK
jgi:hypothetical protein